MTSFQNVGKHRTVSNRDRMECDICWHVHAPAQGDPLWQVPALEIFSPCRKTGEKAVCAFFEAVARTPPAPPAGFSCPDLLRKNFRGQRERAA